MTPDPTPHSLIHGAAGFCTDHAQAAEDVPVYVMSPGAFMTVEHDAPDERKRCEQCGREGTRGFVTRAASVYVHPSLGPISLPESTTCASKRACQKRWYRPRGERYE